MSESDLVAEIPAPSVIKRQRFLINGGNDVHGLGYSVSLCVLCTSFDPD